MRANVRDKHDVIDRIQSLLNLLVSSAKEVTAEVEALTPDEGEQVKNDARHSSVLKSRIQAFIQKLDAILDSAKETHNVKWYQRLWFAEQDAEFLKDLGRQIDSAKDDFKLRGAIEIRQYVGEMAEHAREIHRELRRQGERQEQKESQDILEGLNPANASYTSAQFEEKSLLQPGTRSTILRDLAKWSADSESDKRVHVVFGQAGMGKSSIAYAFCRQVRKAILGTSFFFLRGSGECSDVHRVFPTIAFQLAESVPSIRPQIVEAARKHQAGRKQGLLHQFHALILEPLKCLIDSPSPPIIIIVIDGVDECANTPENGVSVMLGLLYQAAHELPFLRILIATRPEAPILDALKSCNHADIIIWRDLQKEPDVDNDIRLFIDSEFEKCKMAGPFVLTEQHSDAVEELTRLSDGLFIYARTIAKYLSENRYLATERYGTLLESQGRFGPGEAYRKLDILYTLILDNAFGNVRRDEKHMSYVQRIFCWLVLFVVDTLTDLEALHATALNILGIPGSVTMDVIDRLRSVLIVDGTITPSTPIRACHASFPQFLMDPSRCTDHAFLVDPPSGHALIAISLFDLLARDDVDSLRDADDDMPPMWSYARSYWSYHLVAARYTPELGRSLWRFVETHLEDWLRSVGPWVNGPQYYVSLTNACARVLGWYKEHGPDDGLVEMLDEILDRLVKKMAAEANQSPAEFDWREFKRIEA
ncbi:hypothetical protein CERSUDRAFT_154945 [Gelatoporia subvermispora B]|uniref:NACHT domain-containing protein n=1 Tax=Ceriporiopsis subvermispora (strain B) TaxID=914234 RepID=M2PK56_CERS8|nr:hypothetical protein CERSUDRAFT_154945 [Gelatoporia subvermispora B]